MALSNLEEQEIRRNWLDLPSDVTVNILNRIGMVDIVENADKVCTAWHKICKDPAMWRVINMNEIMNLAAKSKHSPTNICRLGVTRSQGQLVDITLAYAYNITLLLYVAQRSSHLRRLEMVCGFLNKRLTDALMNFPLLEELNFYLIKISKEDIETIGAYCPMLKTFKINDRASGLRVRDTDEESLMSNNEVAIAIGENLRGLRHLELIGNGMTNIGLQVIMDNCVRLETLDLRGCFNIDLKGELGEKVSKQVKNLKLPKDSLKGCPYIFGASGESSDEYNFMDVHSLKKFNFWSLDPKFLMVLEASMMAMMMY